MGVGVVVEKEEEGGRSGGLCDGVLRWEEREREEEEGRRVCGLGGTRFMGYFFGFGLGWFHTMFVQVWRRVCGLLGKSGTRTRLGKRACVFWCRPVAVWVCALPRLVPKSDHNTQQPP